MIRHLEVEGYRSIRKLRLSLEQVLVVVGANGTGKSNLLGALRLLRDAADGSLGRNVVVNGGIPSLSWAGDRKAREPVRIRAAVELDELGFELALGPVPSSPGARGGADPSPFTLDPEVKREVITLHGSAIAERTGPAATLRDTDGDPVLFQHLWANESVLSQVVDPSRFPGPSLLARQLASWRFHTHLPVHADAPARRPMTPVRTPVLADDARDLASALRTIHEVGDRDLLHHAVGNALPGHRLLLDGRTVQLDGPGTRRPLTAAELSDGTVRFLCLLAILLSPRPPSLLVLDEPEGSLNDRLLEGLADLIGAISSTTQVILTTHSIPLAEHVEATTGSAAAELELFEGETRVVGQRDIERW